jgi:hypothetical protein
VFSSPSEEEMNKDHLLIKCKEVIESLNNEIEEERVAYKILKEESKSAFLLTFTIDDQLKDNFAESNNLAKETDSQLQLAKTENEQLRDKLSEFEEYVRNSKTNTQFFLEKLNQNVKYEFDKELCDCKELKIVSKQISSKSSL